MNCLIIHAHPDPESFNTAIRNRAIAALEGAGHQVDLDALAAQLNSDRMQAWVQSGGRDYMGGWKGYSKTSFQDFPIDVTAL